MRKLFLVFPLLFLLVGCGVKNAPAPPVLQFENAPVTLSWEELQLRGRLNYDGLGGITLTAEEPGSLHGCTFTLLAGEYTVTCGAVSVPLPQEGSVALLLASLRAFAMEAPVQMNGLWRLSGEEAVQLETDESGAPLRLWDDTAGWKAVFGTE